MLIFRSFSLIITSGTNQLTEVQSKFPIETVILNPPGHFPEKVIRPRFKEFPGLHDDLKSIGKTFNSWPLSCT